MRHAALALVLILGQPLVGQATIVDFIPIGAPGNACEPQAATGLPGGCFGSVASSYLIGTHEVTNRQYALFLNAVDPSGANALGLYNTLMGSDPINGGINATGTGFGARYAVKPGFADRPVTWVSWYDSARFANWMHNGTTLFADTENGAYTLLGGTPIPSNGATVVRNPGAIFFLPSEDEWYKAAYYDTRTASFLENPFANGAAAVCEAPAGGPNSANCGDALPGVTDVGSYPAAIGPNGTFDQGGNVWEWNDTGILSGRGQRGGSWGVDPDILAAPARGGAGANLETGFIGFRVAMIPEPATSLLLLAGMLGLSAGRRRATANASAPRRA